MADIPRKFPEFGLVRLAEIVAPNGVLPVSRSSFLACVKAGRFPQSVKLGPRITAWDAAEIRAFIAALQGKNQPKRKSDTDEASRALLVHFPDLRNEDDEIPKKRPRSQ